jgi:hypothetical protein
VTDANALIAELTEESNHPWTTRTLMVSNTGQAALVVDEINIEDAWVSIPDLRVPFVIPPPSEADAGACIPGRRCAGFKRNTRGFTTRNRSCARCCWLADSCVCVLCCSGWHRWR